MRRRIWFLFKSIVCDFTDVYFLFYVLSLCVVAFFVVLLPIDLISTATSSAAVAAAEAGASSSSSAAVTAAGDTGSAPKLAKMTAPAQLLPSLAKWSAAPSLVPTDWVVVGFAPKAEILAAAPKTPPLAVAKTTSVKSTLVPVPVSLASGPVGVEGTVGPTPVAVAGSVGSTPVAMAASVGPTPMAGSVGSTPVELAPKLPPFGTLQHAFCPGYVCELRWVGSPQENYDVLYAVGGAGGEPHSF